MRNGPCRLLPAGILLGLLLVSLLVPLHGTPAAACRCGVAPGIERSADASSSEPDTTVAGSPDAGVPERESDAEWARWVLGAGLTALLGVTLTLGWRRWRAPE